MIILPKEQAYIDLQANNFIGGDMNKVKIPLEKVTKKNAKASVFTHLFSIPRYKKELYLSLHPNDKSIKEEDIKTWTLFSVFTNIQLNDLGILVRDKILLLMEAQPQDGKMILIEFLMEQVQL